MKSFRNFLAGLSLAVTATAGLTSSASLAQAQVPPAALGIAVGDETGRPVVRQVLAGLTAEKMAVQEGDLIIEAGGKPVSQASEVIGYAHSLTVGAPVALTVRRGDKVLKLAGVAMPRPSDMPAAPPQR